MSTFSNFDVYPLPTGFSGSGSAGTITKFVSAYVLGSASVADFPTLNQNTTGSAAKLTTAQSIYGNLFDGTIGLNQVIGSVYGGTGNGFTKFSGPSTTEKTFTLPNADAILVSGSGSIGYIPKFASSSVLANSPIYTDGTNVGIGTTTPGELLSLGKAGTTKGVLSLAGNTSGKIIIQPASAAGTYTLTLPTTDGNANEFLQTDGSGVLTWASSSAAHLEITTVTNTYSVLATDEFLRCSGTFTVTLPVANGHGRMLYVKNTSTGSVTVAGYGADTIDGEPVQILGFYDGLILVDAALSTWLIT